MRSRALAIAAVMGLLSLPVRPEITRYQNQPTNQSRRAEKDAAALAKAEAKRARKMAKRSSKGDSHEL